ncbi:hypothetical protein EVAR_30819_1 [Eumeta japonica]|uniref:Uncharacterized protein n=1 Tax=Eumeta variegata TaxID=151549 RepID=A0A4C1SIW1_EUMVA|nr:hypothetical protein EVAR_30819_1 [Eumeta japonica]
MMKIVPQSAARGAGVEARTPTRADARSPFRVYFALKFALRKYTINHITRWEWSSPKFKTERVEHNTAQWRRVKLQPV